MTSKRTRRRSVTLLLAPAAWLAACSGMLGDPTWSQETRTQPVPAPERGVVRPPGTSPPEAQVRPPAPVAPTPTAAPSIEVREKQVEILMHAVTALQQEIARNDSRSEDLLKKNERLRAEVDELIGDLNTSRAEDQRLKGHLRALQKELRKIAATPPLAAVERRDGHGESAEVVPRRTSEATKPVRGASAARTRRAQPRRGVYHVVVPGDTLWEIAAAYGVDYRDIARENGIHNPNHIEVGQRIFVRGASSP